MKPKLRPIFGAFQILRSRSGAFRSMNTIVASVTSVFIMVSASQAAIILPVGTSQTLGGAVIEGAGAGGYFVQGGSLTINNATLQNFLTRGGVGSGGGAGLGGAIFINGDATVTLNNVNFLSNTAQGGDGGVAGATGGLLNSIASGPVGGSVGPNGDNAAVGAAFVNGGNGGDGFNASPGGDATNGQGGQGGKGGDGSAGSPVTADTIKAALELAKSIYEAGSDTSQMALFTSISASFTGQAVAAAAGFNVGGPTTAGLAPLFTVLATQFAGLATDATGSVADDAVTIAYEGAYLTALTVTNLAVGAAGNGGGGGQGGNAGSGSDFYGGGLGGAGGDGGQAFTGSPSAAQGGGAGSGGNGGSGGFGGGGGQGGAGGFGGDSAHGENGVDGGGGGGGGGGFGGGGGSDGKGFGASLPDGGSGGSGFGGAIFVRSGGSLTISGNALFDGNNAVEGGTASESGTSGSAGGTDLFMMKGSSVNLNAGEGNEITFNGGIADDSQANLDSGKPTGRGAGITVGSGRVVFNGENTYTGQTRISGGELQAQDGIGVHLNSSINFNGGVLQSSGSFNRYVGNYNATTGLNSNRVMWEGSGGFAAVNGELNVKLANGAAQTWGVGGFVKDGKSLIFGSDSATDSVTFENSIKLGSGNRTILVEANLAMDATLERNAIAANVDNAILNGILSGAGSLTVGDGSHTGVLVLTNANTYSGGTTVNAGTLVFNTRINPHTNAVVSTGRLNANGTFRVNTDGAADMSQAGHQSIGDLAGGGKVSLGGNTLTINQAGHSTFSGVIADGGLSSSTGSSNVTKKGAGTLILSGENTYTGTTQIDSGLITLSGSLASALVNVASGAFLEVTNGGLGSHSSLTNAGTTTLTADDTIGAFTSNAGTLNGAGTKLTAATYALNTGSVIHANLGAGTVTSNGLVALNGTSDAAIFNVVTGTTTLGSAERLLDATALTISSGAKLVLGGAEKIGSLNGQGRLDNNSSRLTADSGSFSGVVFGSGGLTKVSTGVLDLSGANTYTGSTLVTAGTLALSGSGSLVSDTIKVSVGATLTNGTGGLSSLATLTNNGTVNQDSNDTIGALVNTGTINGPGKLTATTYTLNDGSNINSKLGAGSVETNGNVRLTATSDALSVTVNDGSNLFLDGSELLNSGASALINGTLHLVGGNQTINDLNGHGTIKLNTNLLTVTDGASTSSFTGSIDAEGTELATQGGNLTLSGGSSITRSTTVNGDGHLVLRNGANLNTGDVLVQHASEFTVDATSLVDAHTLTVDGTLTAPSSASLHYVLLTGSGEVHSQGGTFTNAAGAMVKGALSFDGNFTNRGTLAAGRSPGVITIAGNYTEAGILETEFGSTVPGLGHDQIRVGGTVTIDSSSTLVVQTFNGVLPVRGSFYQIISDLAGGTKSATGNFGAVHFDVDGLAGSQVAVNNAAVVYDQASGRVTTTGLNGAGSKFADLGHSKNERRAATALLTKATGDVGPNQINTATNTGALALQLIAANGGSSSNLARFTPEHYGALADYAFVNELAVTKLLRDRVSALAGLSKDAAGFSAFTGVKQYLANTPDGADIDRTDIYAGGDYMAANNLTAGIIATHNDGSFSSAYGRADVDGIAGDAYLKAKLNSDFGMFARLGYGTNRYEMHRVTTDTAAQAYGETDSHTYTGSLGLGYAGWTWGQLSLAPTADLTYARASVDGFQETGANDRLALGGYDATHLIGQIGTSLVWATKLDGRRFSAELYTGIEQLLVNNQSDQKATMVNAPVSFNQTFAEDDMTKAAFVLNLGYEVTETTTLTLGYEGRISSNSSNNFNAGIHLSF